MPKKAELEALINPTNCNVAWTDNYNGTGIKGRICTGKTEPYTSNSVFLPAAGYCGSVGVYGQGNDGNYWSSTPERSNFAYGLYFEWGGQSVSDGNRSIGYSVRAVLAEFD